MAPKTSQRTKKSRKSGTAKVQPTATRTDGKGRPCWVCGAPDSTEEHVWPEWLKDHAEQPTGTYRIGLEGDPAATRQWTGGAFELTSRVLCEQCNRRLGDKLEGPSAQLIPSMFKAQSRRLDPSDLRLLAHWFYKTALMVSTANRVPASELPKEHYRGLNTSFDLPPTSTAWIAEIADPSHEVTLRLQRFNWRDPDLANPPRVEGYAFVASVKDVAGFAVIFDTRQSPDSVEHPPLQLGGLGVGKLVRVWPTGDDYGLVWPPPTAMSMAEAHDLLKVIERAARPPSSAG
jgi:5-methylcytosine-specific restriction endonuclease McrA